MNTQVMNRQKINDFEEELFKMYGLVGSFLGCALMIDPSFLLTVTELQEPIRQLKGTVLHQFPNGTWPCCGWLSQTMRSLRDIMHSSFSMVHVFSIKRRRG